MKWETHNQAKAFSIAIQRQNKNKRIYLDSKIKTP